jgi:hypothetical protein
MKGGLSMESRMRNTKYGASIFGTVIAAIKSYFSKKEE